MWLSVVCNQVIITEWKFLLCYKLMNSRVNESNRHSELFLVCSVNLACILCILLFCFHVSIYKQNLYEPSSKL
jgi:hypothetical protein